jgi:hypothetical protein
MTEPTDTPRAETLTQLEQQVRTLTETLEWYADSLNYWYRYCVESTRRTWTTSAQEDCGARARAALRILDEVPKAPTTAPCRPPDPNVRWGEK